MQVRWVDVQVIRLDRFQRRHAVAAFPVAVLKKFGNDRAGSLAALIAYYGFFSIFPLLLVMVTLGSLLLRDDPQLRAQVLSSALTQFPVVGHDIEKNIHAVAGDALTLFVGIAVATWAGMAVVEAAQQAMNTVWGVTRDRGPSFIKRKLRDLLMLVTLGLAVLLGAVVASMSSSLGQGAIVGLLLFLVGAFINVGVMGIAFSVLTVANLSWRQIWPGAIVAGVGWSLLQAFGGYLVDRQIRGASGTYGVFAVVIGLLWWIFLGAQLTLIAAEVDAVRAGHLWPVPLTAHTRVNGAGAGYGGSAEDKQSYEGAGRDAG